MATTVLDRTVPTATNQTNRTTDDPVSDLYAAANSLKLLSGAFQDADRPGDANLMDLLYRQVINAVERLDDEHWMPREELQ